MSHYGWMQPLLRSVKRNPQFSGRATPTTIKDLYQPSFGSFNLVPYPFVYLGMQIFINWVCSHPVALVAFVIFLLAVHRACLALYRLFFHPLSKFPGPKIAAATSFYRKYYDAIRGGEFLEQIFELHKIYGPVVRISPNELHFNDYRAYHEIYSVESRFTKDPVFYRCFNADESAFGVINTDESRTRRSLLHPFFSKQAVLNLEDKIRNKIDQLVSHLERRGSTPSNIFLAYRTATLDIITDYLFGWCQNDVNYPAFEAPLLLDIQDSVPLLWLIRCFPCLIPVLPFVPRWLSPSVHRQFQAFCSVQNFLVTSLDRATAEATRNPDTDHYPISHRFLDPMRQPKHRCMPSDKRPFLDEALSLIQAGSDTVGNTCTVGTFYVLNNKRVQTILCDELKSVWPERDDQVPLSALQALPYLNAVLKESLRLSHGFVTPLPRVVGQQGANIAGFDIPPDTIVGMSAVAVHLNEELFPEPREFIPERWLLPTPQLALRERHLVSFSRGPRACLGSSMAWVELYLFFAYLFRKLDMEIACKSVSDMNSFRDYFIPVHPHKDLFIQTRMSECRPEE